MSFQIHDDSSNELLESQKQSPHWLNPTVDSASYTPHKLTVLTTPLDENPPVFESATPDSTKRYQTKMLLASLIEHFCSAYGDTPDANRKVFFLICQTLRSLGMMDAEFMDEMTSVRSAFQQAFHKLFYTAVQTVRNQDLLEFDSPMPRLLVKDIASSPSSQSAMDYFSQKPCSVQSPSLSKSPLLQSPLAKSPLIQSPLQVSSLSSSSSSSVPEMQPNEFLNLNVQNSRYNTDFVELNLLGKGGFASAYRARNKLDGIDYAIKKIRLGNDIEAEEQKKSDDNPYERIFREIKNLARLEHQNVVRYYSSWLEFDESPIRSDEKNSEDDFEEDDYEDESDSVFHGRDPTFSDYSCDYSGMSQIQFGEGSTSNYDDNPTSSSYTNHRSRNRSRTRQQQKKSSGGWTLFIQMQLCPTTLHDYIRLRNKQYAQDTTSLDPLVETKRNLEIFYQILQGTAYIHEQGLIHRDLKPSNIFLYTTDKHKRHQPTVSACSSPPSSSSSVPSLSGISFSTVSDPVSDLEPTLHFWWEESWVPKIGDFGLAAEAMDDEGTGESVLVPTPISSTPPSPQIGPVSDHTSSRRRPKPVRTRTMGVGTRTYASPEQLAAQIYDEKVDIYSLGIILFELFQPFTTGMERADALDKLKRGIFPHGFPKLYPNVAVLILWMMNLDPQQRPSAEQLLEFESFTANQAQQQDLEIQTTLQQLERENRELRQQLDQAEQAKEEMRQRLEAMQLKLDAYEAKDKQTKKKKEVRWVFS
ncbi:Eukaryotic translation initiation factor 2-alpha kinase 2 [Choanephora cucurbitarum]|uniref:non-specific serine/threonine protein kinase n=1 Tax=Choanephora cucurbitarum TaxID=101091 RepID=A0A1C7MZ85_9FUNG|nr:Eukaryotic translation initiation factor 2-alpha kinase 2 [Choanephora cucurbitarum]